MCGIGALFAFPKGLLVNNSEQLTTSLQQAFLNNNNNNNNNNTNTSSNNQQQENLIKLHYLLQYGNISSTTTIDNNNNNGNNNEELKKNNDDDEDTERNESFQEKINKILSIPLMKQKPKQSTNNNHNDNHSHNNENNNVENSHNCSHNCSHNNENNVETDNNLLSKIKSIETVISPRGPDETHHFILNENFNENVQEDNCATIHSDYNVCLIASLLALRGERPYPQPLQINNEHYLIWNGEIFGNEEYFSDCVLGHENDGMCLLKQLFNCKTEIEVLTVLSNIEGPFSFVYLNKKDNYLLFGRDILGRRSLLYSLNENCTEIVISSVACHLPNFYEWNSIGVNGIFKIQLSNNNCGVSDISDNNSSNSSSIGCKIELLEWDMIYKEINRKPLIADRTCIEPLSSSLLLLNSDNNKENNNEGKEEEDLENYEKLVDQFIEALSNGVRKRVTNIFDRYSNDDDDNNNSSTLSSTHKEEEAQLKKEENNLKHAKVCILFSGGIDSVILTALTHLNISSQEEPIDLLNVSFGNNKNQQEASADRKQAIESYQELKTLYPTRNFRLILINVNPNELQEERTIIEKLIYPQHTVIDFNIGSALWFASRGKGYIYNNNCDNTINNNNKEDNKEDNNERIIEYTSKARVILCGIGSDEQLGGYRRHFKKFKYFGWKGLNEEMDMDIKRLWIRNLGRDDRVISYHGRESRNPFLDEPFINFVRTLPLWYLASFNHVNANSDKQDKKEDNGMKTTLPGDKKILRRAAQKLGLTRSCLYVKRAMQFGSNIAKISFKKQHANDTIDIVL